MEEVEDIGDLTEHYAIEQPYFSPSEKSLLLQYRMSRRHTGTLSPLSSAGTRYNSEYHPEPSTPPLLLSSPSAASLASSHGALSASASASAAFMSPVKRGAGLLQSALPLETPDFPPSHGRVALARRLGQLAQQLTTNADIDELTLTTQLERLEKAVAQSPARVPQYHSPAQFHMHHQNFQHRPARLGVRSQSDVGAMIATSSPAPSLHRSRYSDLSASMLARLSEINAAEFNEETREEPAPKKGMTGKQAEKVIIEATKLNKELSIVVDNLKARLEESDHIHSLLIERAERAAQRIIFLQNRISYLEEELQENDEELQHLRICLKAVEIQLPPHPDLEIQRCISTFKEDFRALKQKRVNRSSVASYSSLDNSQL